MDLLSLVVIRLCRHGRAHLRVGLVGMALSSSSSSSESEGDEAKATEDPRNSSSPSSPRSSSSTGWFPLEGERLSRRRRRTAVVEGLNRLPLP